MTMRLMPPASGLANPISVNGRSYTCASGATLDVPDADAQMLMANAWVPVALGGAGPTAGRPANALRNTQYHDTTLGKIVIWDGKTWRDHTTGAAA